MFKVFFYKQTRKVIASKRRLKINELGPDLVCEFLCVNSALSFLCYDAMLYHTWIFFIGLCKFEPVSFDSVVLRCLGFCKREKTMELSLPTTK